jgi:hypothetical protein
MSDQTTIAASPASSKITSARLYCFFLPIYAPRPMAVAAATAIELPLSSPAVSSGTPKEERLGLSSADQPL